MADNEGVENTQRGSEWEVVQLTASTFAASPGTKSDEQKEEDKVPLHCNVDSEISRALFMSGHFVFPPSQHENLPLEPDVVVPSNKTSVMDVSSEQGAEGGNESDQKDGDNWMLKGFAEDSKLLISTSEFEEASILTSEEENNIGGKTSYSTTEIFRPTEFVDNITILDLNPQRESGSATDISCSPKYLADSEHGRSKLPSDVWWKRTATALYSQVKETNTLWSILIAAAVMGLVVLGQRWQQEKERVLQLKWQVSIGDERNGKLLGSIYRLKDVIVGGYRRGSLIGGTTTNER